MESQTQPKLRVSQIVVSLVLLNEHDSPVTPEPVMFSGNEDGTAVENLALWLETLPMQLELAAAQLPSEQTGASPAAKPNGTS